MPDKKAEALASLREKAESALNAHPPAEESKPNKDVPKLIDEIQVSQAELEIQNEELRDAQRKLERSREWFSILYHQAPVGYVVIDTAGIIVDANWTMAEMLVKERTALFRKPFSKLVAPADQPLFFAQFNSFFKKPGGKTMEIRLMRDNGDLFDASLEGRKLADEASGPHSPADQVLLIVADITARKQSEKSLKASLAEKETLLRELYHRTKNNMQVIISMLNIQARSLKDDTIREMFESATKRIKTMSLVHQRLCEANDLSELDLKEYVNDLIRLAARSGQLPPHIDISTNMESVPANLDTAIPCGLIVNELLSNAFRHAFPSGRGGRIHIHLKKPSADDVEICVSDNGVGLPDGFDCKKTAPVGLQSVAALAEHQLQGTFHVQTGKNKGVSFFIRFKAPNKDRRV